MKVLFFASAIFFIALSASAQQQSFDDFSKKFVDGYKSLKLPDLELSYVSGLQHIGSVESIQKQVDFFRQIKAGLPAYKAAGLTASQKTDYELIKYETGLNLERLALETEWIKHSP